MKPVMNALGEPVKTIILGKNGQPLILSREEQIMANMVQKQLRKNALGAEIDVTTLSTIMKKISEQKFFEISPADFLPVRVGEGAWSSNLVTYRSFQTGGGFADGVVNQSTNNGRLASAGAAVDAIPVVVKNWAKEINWTIMELNQAAKSGNWDLVTSLERSRKTNWDLGIQEVAFLGLAGDANVEGLLGMTGITNNTARITKSLKSMTATELSAFMQAILDDYRTNCNRTAWPTHFIIPESDYLGLATPSNADYPLKSKLEIIQDTLRVMTKNPNFQVLPLAYADAAYNVGAGINKQRYVLLNYQEETLRMDIPVQYTSTLANSVNNFQFQNVGYGQFTGVKAYRPLEVLYYSY